MAENSNRGDFELAAALFSLLGETVPHNPAREEEAARILDATPDSEELLLRIVSLCGDPESARQNYLCAKAYSRLGEKYARETVRYAEKYLRSPGWDALPDEKKEEQGIPIHTADRQKAAVYVDLAVARESLGDLAQAYSDYRRACLLEPYNAMSLIKAAEVLRRLRGGKEAMDFLLEQKNSLYYKPVRYRDASGQLRVNDLFRRLLDAEIVKLRSQEAT